ncbi:MAG: type IV secretory system conjugative DNA transfer family protein, partial [Bacteroidota bacterium]
MYRPFVEALFILFVVLLFLLGAEYYVLAFPDQLSQTAEGLLHRFTHLVQRLGFAGRISWLITYAGFYLSLVATNRNDTLIKRNTPKRYYLPAIILLTVASYYLLNVTSYPITTVGWLYPGAVVSILILLPLSLKALRRKEVEYSGKYEVNKINTPDSIVIRAQRGYLNVPNPYRGTLIVGSSGSGKSESIGNAFLQQFVHKGFAGIVYDFKFPVLANVLNTALHRYDNQSNLCYYIVNFFDLSRSHRCNPLAPENIPTLSHAEEYAQAIVSNLDTNTIKQRDFFAASAQAWLTALIWFFRSE